jgi:molybdenum cofactor cytidylyltransferase
MITSAILIASDGALIEGVPIALLPWRDDETLIEFQVAQLLDAGVDVVEVVLGFEAEHIIPLVARDNVEPIVNDRWREGVAGSIRVGATAVPRETDTAIVVRVDEPRSAGVYRRLLDEHRRTGAPITQASSGSPIVVSRAMLAELRNVTDGGGLEAVLARQAEETVQVAFEGDAIVRIETADGYALARLSGRFE